MPYKNPEDRKSYLENNKEKIAAQAVVRHQKRLRKNIEYVREIKSTTPCYDCSIIYPYYVMDFDHIEDKAHEVSRLMRGGGTETLKKEIAKCEIVCSNCHRERTYRRQMLN